MTDVSWVTEPATISKQRPGVHSQESQQRLVSSEQMHKSAETKATGFE
jgi:hypothetical protein